MFDQCLNVLPINQELYRTDHNCALIRSPILSTQENKTIHKDQSGVLWIHIGKFFLYGFLVVYIGNTIGTVYVEVT